MGCLRAPFARLNSWLRSKSSRMPTPADFASCDMGHEKLNGSDNRRLPVKFTEALQELDRGALGVFPEQGSLGFATPKTRLAQLRAAFPDAPKQPGLA